MPGITGLGVKPCQSPNPVYPSCVKKATKISNMVFESRRSPRFGVAGNETTTKTTSVSRRPLKISEADPVFGWPTSEQLSRCLPFCHGQKPRLLRSPTIRLHFSTLLLTFPPIPHPSRMDKPRDEQPQEKIVVRLLQQHQHQHQYQHQQP